MLREELLLFCMPPGEGLLSLLPAESPLLLRARRNLSVFKWPLVAYLSAELLFRLAMVGDIDSALSERAREDISIPAVVCSASMKLFMNSSMGWVLRPSKNTFDRRFCLQAARLAISCGHQLMLSSGLTNKIL